MSFLRKCLGNYLLVLPLVLVVLAPAIVLAQEAPTTAATPAQPDLAAQVAELTAKVASSKVAADTVWTLIAGFLVFWMNAGFALVESGFCRVKNAVNILSKNFVVFALSSVSFFFLGLGLMFGD